MEGGIPGLREGRPIKSRLNPHLTPQFLDHFLLPKIPDHATQNWALDIANCDVRYGAIYKNRSNTNSYYFTTISFKSNCGTVKVSAHYCCERLFDKYDDQPRVLKGQLAWPEFLDDPKRATLDGDGTPREPITLTSDPGNYLVTLLFDSNDFNALIGEASISWIPKNLSMNDGHILSIQFRSTDKHGRPIYSPYYSFLIYAPHKKSYDKNGRLMGYTEESIREVKPIEDPNRSGFPSPTAARRYLETARNYRDCYNSILTQLFDEEK